MHEHFKFFSGIIRRNIRPSLRNVNPILLGKKIAALLCFFSGPQETNFGKSNSDTNPIKMVTTDL